MLYTTIYINSYFATWHCQRLPGLAAMRCEVWGERTYIYIYTICMYIYIYICIYIYIYINTVLYVSYVHTITADLHRCDSTAISRSNQPLLLEAYLAGPRGWHMVVDNTTHANKKTTPLIRPAPLDCKIWSSDFLFGLGRYPLVPTIKGQTGAPSGPRLHVVLYAAICNIPT